MVNNTFAGEFSEFFGGVNSIFDLSQLGLCDNGNIQFIVPGMYPDVRFLFFQVPLQGVSV